MNLLKDIASGAWQVVKTVAPTVADAAAGPFAPLVDPVVKKIFGTNDAQGTEAALLTATPDQLLALKKADADLQVQLEQLGITRDKLAFDDTANARQMQMQTKDPTARQLAWLLVGGYLVAGLALVIAMIASPTRVALIPAAAWALIGSIFGYLAKGASGAETFYFGSSADSQAKTQTLSEIAKQ